MANSHAHASNPTQHKRLAPVRAGQRLATGTHKFRVSRDASRIHFDTAGKRNAIIIKPFNTHDTTNEGVLPSRVVRTLLNYFDHATANSLRTWRLDQDAHGDWLLTLTAAGNCPKVTFPLGVTLESTATHVSKLPALAAKLWKQADDYANDPTQPVDLDELSFPR